MIASGYMIAFDHGFDRSQPAVRGEPANGPCANAVHFYWFQSDAEVALKKLPQETRAKARVLAVTITVYS